MLLLLAILSHVREGQLSAIVLIMTFASPGSSRILCGTYCSPLKSNFNKVLAVICKKGLVFVISKGMTYEPDLEFCRKCCNPARVTSLRRAKLKVCNLVRPVNASRPFYNSIASE